MKRITETLTFLLLLILTGCSAQIDTPPYSDIVLTATSREIEIGTPVEITVSANDGRELGKLGWTVDNGRIIEEKSNSGIVVETIAEGNLIVSAREEKSNKTSSISIMVKAKPETPDSPERKDGKEVIISRLRKINEWNQKEHISSDYSYPKRGSRFTTDAYRLMLKPGETFTLSLVDSNGMPEKDVEWFVESTIFSNENGMYLFSVDESNEDNGTDPSNAWKTSPVILKVSGEGIVQIEGSARFKDSDYQQTGSILAVVDNRYVHRIPFYVYNAREMEKIRLHDEVQLAVKTLSEPLMKYSDIERAYMMNRSVMAHLRYVPGAAASPYNYFVKGEAVCQGYALMYKRLGDELGIKTRYLVGNTDSGLHAWNAVWLDDGYYYVDTTWNDTGNTQLYFFMDRETFEGVEGGSHQPRLEGQAFGSYYLSDNFDYGPMFNKFMYERLTPENDIPVPELEKVTFIGHDRNSGFLKTEESGIEYNLGDGVWRPLEAGEDSLIEGINMPDEAYYHPGGSASIIGSPQSILLRRRTSSGWSNYVKKTVYRPSYDPIWIESDRGNVLYANTEMEYREISASSYTDVESNELTLKPGTYLFRIKGSENKLASDPVEIIIE